MISVLTLVHGRKKHLENLLSGLERSEVKPDEVVIVHMNEPITHRRNNHFSIVTTEIGDDQFLPLASARNAAVATANNEHLIFLDVDCVPGPTLVADYAASIRDYPDALHQGEVRYLPENTDVSGLSSEQLTLLAPRHVVHTLQLPGQTRSYDLFWSLNFSCLQRVFEKIGGFNEHYRGYGAEDTDFSYRARSKGIPVRASQALAFHQYHPSHDPPLNHLASIVANARTFKSHWGQWPMRGWLDDFARRGFISIDRDHITLKREPTADEIAACVSR